MAIFRCNNCAYLREVPGEHAGKSAKCPQCKEVVRIHDTVAFVDALLKKYSQQNRELLEMKQRNTELLEMKQQVPPEEGNEDDAAPERKKAIEEVDVHHAGDPAKAGQSRPIMQWLKKKAIEMKQQIHSEDNAAPEEKKALEEVDVHHAGDPAKAGQSQPKMKQQIHSKEDNEDDAASEEKKTLEGIDINHTGDLAKADQYQPIVRWFSRKGIAVEANEKSMDTTGFFDEVAIALGKDFEVLKEVLDQIKNAQKKGYANVNLNLAKKSQEDTGKITKFCRELHNCSFVARYSYQREDKILRLKLQAIPAIAAFFGGGWLEWLVFMRMLEFFREKNMDISCLRNLNVTFPNKDSYELDIFFLVDGKIPVCIECKSGEFQQHIDKCMTLKKRMGLAKNQYIMCVLGLGLKQCQGLTGMHDLTFANESNLLDHVGQLCCEAEHA